MFAKILSTLLFIPALAMAEDSEIVLFEALCVDLKTISETVKEYGELPFLTSTGHRVDGNRKKYNPTFLFLNPQSRSWTMVEKVDEDNYCVIAAGTKMEPYKAKK